MRVVDQATGEDITEQVGARPPGVSGPNGAIAASGATGRSGPAAEGAQQPAVAN